MALRRSKLILHIGGEDNAGILIQLLRLGFDIVEVGGSGFETRFALASLIWIDLIDRLALELNKCKTLTHSILRRLHLPHGVPPEHLDRAVAQAEHARKVPLVTRWTGPRSSVAWWLFSCRRSVSERAKVLPHVEHAADLSPGRSFIDTAEQSLY